MITSGNCSRCHEHKPLTEFYKRKDMSDGRVSACIECTQAWCKQHYSSEVEKKRSHDYYLANRELARSRARQRYANNIEAERARRRAAYAKMKAT
jgi:hypothetical protein